MNADDRTQSNLASSLHAPLSPRSPTVLCVDDDPDTSEALSRVFRLHGIRVLRAFFGIQGLALAISDKPDVIILDLEMPKGQGTEILDCLKRNPLTAPIPVIILTGKRDPGLRKKLKAQGATQFFNKPVPFEEILDEIHRHIAPPTLAEVGQ